MASPTRRNQNAADESEEEKRQRIVGYLEPPPAHQRQDHDAEAQGAQGQREEIG